MLDIGTVIEHRYEVVAILGSGAFAKVYKVRHVGLLSFHALKVLLPTLAADEDTSTFQSNSAVQQGAAILAMARSGGTPLQVTRSAFSAHLGVPIQAYYTPGEVLLQSCIFADNSGGGVYGGDDAHVTMENVTVVGSGSGSSGYDGDGANAIIRNSIFFDNEGYAINVQGAPTVENNLFSSNAADFQGIQDPTGSDGNIDDDPLFALYYEDGDFSNDDLTLQVGSPAINAGKSSATYNDVDGTRNDMGAFGGPMGNWTPVWY